MYDSVMQKKKKNTHINTNVSTVITHYHVRDFVVVAENIHSVFVWNKNQFRHIKHQLTW